MSSIVIASQLPAAFNHGLRQQLPDAHIIDLPRGAPLDLDPAIAVLLATPMKIHGNHVPDRAPPGWPYGLGLIQLMSSGIDAYPRWLLDRLPVTTAKGSSANAIAEFALAALFAAAKQLPHSWINDAARWDWNQRPRLATLRGSTLGIVGFGAIGRELAAKALALGIKVLALRRSAQPFGLEGVQRAADLNDLFSRSDHVVLAAPLTAATRHLIDRQVLAAAKPGLHLINISRGGLLDHAALLDALDDGRLGLASLDVTEPEPLPPGHRLYSHPLVRLTPHIAASAPEVMDNVAALFIANVAAFRNGGPYTNLLDHADIPSPSPQGANA